MQPAAQTPRPNDEFRLTLGDHVRALCALLEVPQPENTISINISSEGLKIEYGDGFGDGRAIIRTVQSRGNVQFRPLDPESASQQPGK